MAYNENTHQQNTTQRSAPIEKPVDISTIRQVSFVCDDPSLHSILDCDIKVAKTFDIPSEIVEKNLNAFVDELQITLDEATPGSASDSLSKDQAKLTNDLVFANLSRETSAKDLNTRKDNKKLDGKYVKYDVCVPCPKYKF